MCAYGIDRQPRGAALVIVMLIMAVLLLAGTTFLTISSTESQIALNERVSAQAFHLAEAAIHKAIAQLDASPSYTGESNTTLGNGTSTVTVTTAAGCTANSARVLDATASVPVRGGTAQARIMATVDTISYPYRWATFAAVPNGVVTSPNQMIFGDDREESELWLKNNSTTDSFDSTLGSYNGTTNSGTGGNIGGNADVSLGNGVQVMGSVRAAAAETFPTVTPPSAPLLPPCSSSSCSIPAGTYSIPAGTYSVSSLDVTGGTNANPTTFTPGGPVTIYVTGNVTLGDNVTFGSPGTQFQIFSKSNGSSWLDTADFTTGENFRLYGSLYGKFTNIKLGSRAQVYGSIIGRTIVANENSSFHFDQAMHNQEVCRSDGTYAIRRGTWREVIP